MLKRTKHGLLLTTFAGLAVSPLVAQDEAGKARSARTQQEGMQAEKDQAKFVKTQRSDQPLVNLEGERLGSVVDHVVDARSGSIVFVAARLEGADAGEGRAVLVPFDRFEWSEDEGELRVAASVEDLRALPAFEKERFTGGAEAREAGGERTGQPVEAGALASRYAVTSAIAGSSVVAGESPLGVASDLLLNAKTGDLDFVLAQGRTGGGDPHVVPWRALEWTMPRDGQQHVLKLRDENLDLSQAPTLEGGDVEALNDEEKRSEIDEFYGATGRRAVPERR